ncbi:MAG: aminotransferase class I/II-fold pyridoxal phosphate-dependent enzyme [Acidimicrobiales bacterium]
MDIFAKCHDPRLEELRSAQALGLMPFFRELDVEAPPGLVMLGSNNYLGLAQDPRVKLAAADALEAYGTGCTGSRLMNGTLSLHRQLEEELAEWMGTEACLVFTTGYGVNLGVISTLVGPEDLVLADSASHASVVDGTRMCSGKARLFSHNSESSLRRRLAAWSPPDGGALVVVEGVYSMEGDVGLVGPLEAACRELGARLMVDEAHSLGVLGPEGAGVAAAGGVKPDLLMGTFSKSLASCGGFLAGPSEVVDYLRIACRPFLFTASGVPAAVAAALAAARIARKEDWRRDAVLDRSRQLHRGLAELGYNVGSPPPAAIVPVVVGDDWSAGTLWNALLQEGVYTNCCVAPAVSRDGALLRCSVEATHAVEDIDRAIEAFGVVRSKLA